MFPEDDIELYLHCRFVWVPAPSKMENAVKTLGREDAEQLLQEKQSIVVVCEYCNTEYPFSRGEVDQLFDDDAAGHDG